MQCKDIPDRPVLEFLRKLDGVGATWFDYEPRPPNTVLRAMPTGTPEKLALAKMRMLMRRGLAGYRVCTGLRGLRIFHLGMEGFADMGTISGDTCVICAIDPDTGKKVAFCMPGNEDSLRHDYPWCTISECTLDECLEAITEAERSMQ